MRKINLSLAFVPLLYSLVFSQSITLKPLPPGPIGGAYYQSQKLHFTWTASTEIKAIKLWMKKYVTLADSGNAVYEEVHSVFLTGGPDTAIDYTLNVFWKWDTCTQKYVDFRICGYTDTSTEFIYRTFQKYWEDSVTFCSTLREKRVVFPSLLSQVAFAIQNAEIGDSISLTWNHQNTYLGTAIPHNLSVELEYSKDGINWTYWNNQPLVSGFNSCRLYLDCSQFGRLDSVFAKVNLYDEYRLVSKAISDSVLHITPKVTNTPSINTINGTIGTSNPDSGKNVVTISLVVADADLPGDLLKASFNGGPFDRVLSAGANSIQYTGCVSDSVSISVSDRYCNKKDTTIYLQKLYRRGPVWGYPTNEGSIDPYRDMKVFVSLDSNTGRWPSNPDQGRLSRGEIDSAISLGLNVWASVLPDMHWTFCDSLSANFEIYFGPCQDCGGASWPWKIIIVPEFRKFRKGDLASPKFLYERNKTLYNKDSAIWCIWTNQPNSKDGHAVGGIKDVSWKTAKDSLVALRTRNDTAWHTDAVICLHGSAKSLPYDNIFGKGVSGYADISSIMQHEFAHSLMGRSSHDDGYNQPIAANEVAQPPCMFFSAKQSEIARVDNDTVFIDSSKFVARGGFRKYHLSSITDTLSPGALLGNTWNYCWPGGRGIFDLDADRLASGSATDCDCDGDTTGGKYLSNKQPYQVSYPEIRPGWKIIMRNCKDPNKEFITRNWQEAQDSMGWVHSNDAREAKWFLYDIFNPNPVYSKAERIAVNRNPGKKKK